MIKWGYKADEPPGARRAQMRIPQQIRIGGIMVGRLFGYEGANYVGDVPMEHWGTDKAAAKGGSLERAQRAMWSAWFEELYGPGAEPVDPDPFDEWAAAAEYQMDLARERAWEWEMES